MNTSDYPTCEQTFATLRIFPANISSAEITNLLGIRPTSLKHGWFLSSEGQVDSVDLRQHIDWVIDQLFAVKDALHKLQYSGSNMDIHCYWLSKYGHGGPTISPAQMLILGELKLELLLDIYPGSNNDNA